MFNFGPSGILSVTGSREFRCLRRVVPRGVFGKLQASKSGDRAFAICSSLDNYQYLFKEQSSIHIYIYIYEILSLYKKYRTMCLVVPEARTVAVRAVRS